MQTKSKKVFAAVFTAFLLIAALFAVMLPNFEIPVRAEEAELSTVSISGATYKQGETIEIPAASFTYGGEEYAATAVVKFPGGAVQKANNGVQLNEAGRYTVVYSAYAGEKFLSESVYFDVTGASFGFSGAKSSATYGVDNSQYNTGKSGIMLSLAANETFTYNALVDLNSFTADDPAVSLFLLPQTQGEYDARKLYIRFTDAYDPENYITVLAQGVTNTSTDLNWAHSTAYLQAGAPNQTMIGIEANSSGGNIHRNDVYGKQIYFSFFGDNAAGECVVGEQSIDLSFDLEQKQVLTKDGRGGSNLVVDLDDPEYQTQSLWEGFTTGLVYISLYADEYVNESMGVMITKLGNCDLSLSEYSDTTKPTVAIDYDESSLLQGLAGYSYPVFDATAFDDYDGGLPVSVRVFYGYYTSNRFEIGVNDGRFATQRAGLYTVEYTATDKSGNTAVATVDITVTGEAAPISVSVTEPTAPGDGFVAGETVELTGAEISGGVGELALTVTVESEDGDIYSVEDNSFRPLTAGKYTVEYKVTDFVGQSVSESYHLEIVENANPVFMTDAVLPKYFVENSPYVLPSLSAVALSDGSSINAEISVNDGNGERSVAGGMYYPKANADGVTVITYTATTATGEKSVSYTVPVISGARNGTSVDLGKYFYSDTLEITAGADGYRFTASNAVSGNAGFEYILPLYADGLNISFYVDGAANGFDSLTLILTDYSDRGKSVRLTFEKTANTSILKINGKTVSDAAVGFNGDLFQFTYSDTEYTVSDGANILGTISTYANGTAFNGFESGLVYLSMELEGISSDSSFCISAINGQRFNSGISVDTVRAAMFVEYEPTRRGYIGQQVSLAKALAVDVLDPYVSCYITVLDADGNTVCADDGTYLDRAPADKEYSFTVTQYGSYVVIYQAFGSDMRKTEESYSVEVYDDVAPVLTVSGAVPSSAKVDKRVELPAASAVDNIDGEVTVYVYIASPAAAMLAADSDGNGGFSFTPESRGEYRVRYVAVDAAGNIAVLEYSLSVD